jgi:hypothetical protein
MEKCIYREKREGKRRETICIITKIDEKIYLGKTSRKNI